MGLADVPGAEAGAAEAGAESPAQSGADSARIAGSPESVPAGAAVQKKPGKHVAAFYELADELLAVLEPREALASLAAAAYSGDLDPRRYGEVRDVSVDSAATARLYVGIGKLDGAWPKDVVAVVKRLTGLPDRLVDDVEVLERFSFVSVPFEAAEKAIAEARKQRGAPPIRIASPKSGPGGPRRPYGPKGGGGYDKPRPFRPHGAGPSGSSGGKPYGKPYNKPHPKG